MATSKNVKYITDIWATAAAFKTDFAASVFAGAITETNQVLLYNMLCANYSKAQIYSNIEDTTFKLKVFDIIYQYGPIWQKKMEIQYTLRNLTEEELMVGAKQISNHAYNPGQAPGTAALEEILQVNDQNTMNYKKSKMEAYGMLWNMLDSDITREFLDRFRKLFRSFLEPVYEIETDDEESEE